MCVVYGNLNLDFIPTIEQIQNQLNRKDPTSLYDAIYLAADKLRQSKNLKRTLLVISDSADKNSRHSFSELSKQLKSFDVQIYAVIFDESEMRSFSDITRGGKFRRRISSDDQRASLITKRKDPRSLVDTKRSRAPN